jgi:UDP-2,4-diacetamido-2,4,6-trideoxy-beta-L-altropyranose hydrolase
MSPRIAIRADASIKIGTGHIVRTVTLADELRVRRCDVIFVTRADAGHLNSLIDEHGFDRCTIDTLSGSELDDADETRALIGDDVDCVILDHYSLGHRWEAVLRPKVGRLFVIDDLARPHVCDMLLDQNGFPPQPDRYANLVPYEATVLLGPHYALLRPQFRTALRKATGLGEGVFVFYGGSDEQNETAKAVRALSASRWRDSPIDIVIGTSNPHALAVAEMARLLPRALMHRNVSDMAALMIRNAWALGAAGTTSWERCSIGLPALVTVLAENQTDIARDLGCAGAVRALGTIGDVTESAYVAAMNDLSTDDIKVMRDSGLRIVDGSGAGRVADTLLSILKNV